MSENKKLKAEYLKYVSSGLRVIGLSVSNQELETIIRVGKLVEEKGGLTDIAELIKLECSIKKDYNPKKNEDEQDKKDW